MKQLSWYIQDKVILLTLKEDIHLEQMQAINDEIISMIETRDSQVLTRPGKQMTDTN